MTPEKIDHALRVSVDAFAQEGKAGLKAHFKELGLTGGTSPSKPVSAAVFLHCAIDADLRDLADHGVQVNQTEGEIRTAFLPLRAVEQVSDDPRIASLTMSRYRRPSMDIAPGAVNVPAFKQRGNLSGKGVVFGVVDSGLDPTHAAFQGRIHSIWDQTMHGKGVKEGGYGMELMNAQILASRDFVGHGTHVTGIAAGQDPTYGGIAPDAVIVAVKTDFSDAHIADGVRYIFRIARALNLPAVVNLSLGGHSDAHDGTDALSKSLDQLAGPGRIICCAAGNEGTDNIHAQTTLAPGETQTIAFEVPKDASFVELNGWYPHPGTVSVCLVGPSGLATPPRLFTPGASNYVRETIPKHVVSVTTPGRDPANGDFNPRITVTGQAGAEVQPGTWKLKITNTGSQPTRFDVWVLSDEETPVGFTGPIVDDSMKVGSPGASASAITVAAYTTKTKWEDMARNTTESGETVNMLCDFTSPGPLRNGALKPDITAPGSMIFSALSSFSNQNERLIIDATHVGMQGTSMATPFISGVIACLLQRDSKLDPVQVKDLLRKHSMIPGRNAGAFDPAWGYGLINAKEL